jgi:hypothetical protein
MITSLGRIGISKMSLRNSETVIEAGFTYFEYLRHLFIISVYNETMIYISWAIQIKFDKEYRYFMFFSHGSTAQQLIDKN